MYHVYVLLSKKDGKFYTGQTNNLKKRLNKHSAGLVKATRHRRPLELFLSEEYATRSEAMKREKFLKSGAGHKLLKKKLADASRKTRSS